MFINFGTRCKMFTAIRKQNWKSQMFGWGKRESMCKGIDSKYDVQWCLEILNLSIVVLREFKIVWWILLQCSHKGLFERPNCFNLTSRKYKKNYYSEYEIRLVMTPPFNVTPQILILFMLLNIIMQTYSCSFC